jgi:hypothetical protein
MGTVNLKERLAEFDSSLCERLSEIRYALNFDVSNWRLSALKTNVESSQTMLLGPLDERSTILLHMVYYYMRL